MQDLGIAISKARTYRKHTQATLSNLTGISQGYLSKIEKGERLPTIENIRKIANALNMPTYILIYLSYDREKLKNEKGKFFELLFKNYDLLVELYLKATNEAANEKGNLLKEENVIEDRIDKVTADLELLKREFGDFNKVLIRAEEPILS